MPKIIFLCQKQNQRLVPSQTDGKDETASDCKTLYCVDSTEITMHMYANVCANYLCTIAISPSA